MFNPAGLIQAHIQAGRYQTTAFDPSDPRNVAAGHTSVTVTATATDNNAVEWLKKHQGAALATAAALLLVAIVARR